jgi:hypothetical protein
MLITEPNRALGPSSASQGAVIVTDGAAVPLLIVGLVVTPVMLVIARSDRLGIRSCVGHACIC